MPIQTVVRDVQLAADKPLRVWRLPLQHFVPSFEPVKFLGHTRPKAFRIGCCFRTQALELCRRFYVRLCGKRWRRRKDAFLVLEGFNIAGDCGHAVVCLRKWLACFGPYHTSIRYPRRHHSILRLARALVRLTCMVFTSSLNLAHVRRTSAR